MPQKSLMFKEAVFVYTVLHVPHVRWRESRRRDRRWNRRSSRRWVRVLSHHLRHHVLLLRHCYSSRHHSGWEKRMICAQRFNEDGEQMSCFSYIVCPLSPDSCWAALDRFILTLRRDLWDEIWGPCDNSEMCYVWSEKIPTVQSVTALCDLLHCDVRWN